MKRLLLLGMLGLPWLAVAKPSHLHLTILFQAEARPADKPLEAEIRRTLGLRLGALGLSDASISFPAADRVEIQSEGQVSPGRLAAILTRPGRLSLQEQNAAGKWSEFLDGAAIVAAEAVREDWGHSVRFEVNEMGKQVLFLWGFRFA